jgi:flagellar hook capping protein FlgD
MVRESPSLLGRTLGGAGRAAAERMAIVLAFLLPSQEVSVASAQVAQPDQKISRLNALQGQPWVSAAENKVFGTWFGGEGPGNSNVGYGYSLDRGATWVNEIGLPVVPPFDEVFVPASGWLTDDGTVHLVTDHNGLQYFKGVGFSPIVWGTPTIAFDIYTSNFDGYDNHVVNGDASLGYVYLCATQRTDPAYNYVVLFSTSQNNGATWPVPTTLSGPSCNGSNMVVGADGSIYVSWVDYSLGQAMLRRSTDHGASFGPAVVAANMLDNLAAPPPTWQLPFSTGNRTYPIYFALSGAPNFPGLAVDRSNGPNSGTLYLTWAEHASGTVTPASTSVVDADNNDSFTSPQQVPMNCDIVGLLSSVDVHFDQDVYAFDGVAGQTIWLAGSTSGVPSAGTTWFLDEELPGNARLQLDAQTIFNPVLLSPTVRAKPAIITLPSTGRYFLSLYSNQTAMGYTLSLREYLPAPGAIARDMRDIVLVRSTDGGMTWGPKVRVNHDPPGADQCMPNVAVDGLGHVYVAWYDRRGFALGDSVNAYASVSLDGGQTFGQDLKLSSAPSSWSGPEAATRPGQLIGDRIAIAAGDNYGVVAWADLRDWYQDSNIYAARIVSDIPTAVNAVSDLSGELVAGGVRLSWYVNDARAVAGLRVYRAAQGEAEVALGASDLVPTREGRLDYLDTATEPGQTYEYRLQVRSGGRLDWLGPVIVATPARITSLAWRAAWPNPFAWRTSVKLAVPRVAEGSVRVYDVQGKEVRTLAAGRFEPGERSIEWDGRDATGGMAAPGLYFVAAQVGGESARMRVARVP